MSKERMRGAATFAAVAGHFRAEHGMRVIHAIFPSPVSNVRRPDAGIPAMRDRRLPGRDARVLQQSVTAPHRDRSGHAMYNQSPHQPIFTPCPGFPGE